MNPLQLLQKLVPNAYAQSLRPEDDPNSPNFRVQYMNIPTYSSSGGGENDTDPNTSPSVTESWQNMSLEPYQRSFGNVVKGEQVKNDMRARGFKDFNSQADSGNTFQSFINNLPIYPDASRAKQRQEALLSFLKSLLGG